MAWPAAAVSDLRQGLVAYWQLDAANGASTPDATVFTNHLTLVGMDSSNFVPGQRGNAAVLNGSSTYMSLLHGSDNQPTGFPVYQAGSYSIAMWVKGAPVVNRYLFSEGNTTNNNPLFILQTGTTPANSNRLDVIIRGDTGTTAVNHRYSTNVVFDDTWHHIVWVDDRGNARLYVDGVLDPADFTYTRPAAGITFLSTAVGTLVRAAVSTANIFNGLIDDVGVWERALTPSEVQAVMANAMTTPVPGFAPFFTVQPTNVTRKASDRVTLTGNASGNRPVTYQWQRNGVDLTGQTNRSLILTNLSTTNSGNYTLVAINSFGQTSSQTATLTVEADAPPALQNGLVSLWPFDVLNGDLTPDAANGNHMRLVNMDASNLVTGQRTNALTFDGIEEYTVKVSGLPIYQTNNSAYSVAFWVKADGLNQTNRQVFSESSTNDNNPLFIIGTDTTGQSRLANVFIRTSGGTTLMPNVRSTREVFDGAWHHVVWVDDNGRARLFIDGQLDATDFNYTRGSLTLNTTSVGAIKRAAVGNYFQGTIDEVATWNRALSAGEAQQIVAQGIPKPVTATPPSIVTQPASRTAFSGMTVEFLVQATGTSPLHYQWRKGGAPISAQTNATLTLPNVQTNDSGNYTVVITNSAGSVTSAVATLTVTQRDPPPATLSIDFNNRPSVAGDTEPGFQEFLVDGTGIVTAPTTRTYSGVDITVAGTAGNPIDTRKRTAPVNNGDFTQEKLLQDFIFARGGVGEGIDVNIQFLEANTRYSVTIWSFDTSSTGTRESDWTANGEPVQTGYRFGGQTAPTSNDQYQFTFSVMSDNSGTIHIQSRRTALSVGSTGASDFGSFLNALRVEKSRAGLVITRITVPDNLVRITFETANPTWEHKVQEVSSLISTQWTDVAGVSFSSPSGNVITAEFPRPAGEMRFYRVTTAAPLALFSDDFEQDLGWTHGGVGDSWEKGTPTIGPGSAHSGSNVWSTGLSRPYANDTMQWLRSPVIDLTTRTNATLEFWEYRDIEPLFLGAPVDYAAVRVKNASDPNGPELVELSRDVGSQNRWTKRQFVLPPSVLGRNVIIEFFFKSDDFQPTPPLAGWFIDDVSVR